MLAAAQAMAVAGYHAVDLLGQAAHAGNHKERGKPSGPRQACHDDFHSGSGLPGASIGRHHLQRTRQIVGIEPRHAVGNLRVVAGNSDKPA